MSETKKEPTEGCYYQHKNHSIEGGFNINKYIHMVKHRYLEKSLCDVYLHQKGGWYKKDYRGSLEHPMMVMIWDNVWIDNSDLRECYIKIFQKL